MSYLDPRFIYHTAASHADAAAFRRRQAQRIRDAKPKAANVRAIKERRNGTRG